MPLGCVLGRLLPKIRGLEPKATRMIGTERAQLRGGVVVHEATHELPLHSLFSSVMSLAQSCSATIPAGMISRGPSYNTDPHWNDHRILRESAMATPPPRRSQLGSAGMDVWAPGLGSNRIRQG